MAKMEDWKIAIIGLFIITLCLAWQPSSDLLYLTKIVVFLIGLLMMLSGLLETRKSYRG